MGLPEFDSGVFRRAPVRGWGAGLAAAVAGTAYVLTKDPPASAALGATEVIGTALALATALVKLLESMRRRRAPRVVVDMPDSWPPIDAGHDRPGIHMRLSKVERDVSDLKGVQADTTRLLGAMSIDINEAKRAVMDLRGQAWKLHDRLDTLPDDVAHMLSGKLEAAIRDASRSGVILTPDAAPKDPA